VALFGILALAGADCFGSADDGGARSNRGDDSQDHDLKKETRPEFFFTFTFYSE
jgi:hypothetical protein